MYPSRYVRKLESLRQHLKQIARFRHTVEKLISELESPQFSQNSLAEYLGITVKTLRGYIARGVVKPGSISLGKQTRFTLEEAEKAREAIRRCPKHNVHVDKRHKREQAGLFTIRGAADYLGMPRVTFRVWLERGRVPRPTHRHNGRGWRYYSLDELDKIREDNAKYFRRI